MAYYTGDIPAEDIVIEPAINGDPIDLTPFETAAEVIVRAPDGTIVDSTAGFVATVDAVEGQVVIEWPTDTTLDQAGVYTMAVTLVTNDGGRMRLPAVYLVAQSEDGWYTLDQAREDWLDAPSSDGRLFQLLALAQEQVIAFAPALVDEAPVPPRYKAGQLDQARNLWNSGKVDPASGAMGDDSFVLRPYPLDWMVKQVLRPKHGVPAVR